MGTTGYYGFRKNGTYKVLVAYFDAIPEYLGKAVADFCVRHSLAEMNQIFDRIELLDPYDFYREVDGVSAEEMMQRIEKMEFAEFEHFADDFRFMIDLSKDIEEGFFSDFAYIINLDKEVLEFWMVSNTGDLNTPFGSNFKPRPRKAAECWNQFELEPLKGTAEEIVSLMVTAAFMADCTKD